MWKAESRVGVDAEWFQGSVLAEAVLRVLPLKPILELTLIHVDVVVCELNLRRHTSGHNVAVGTHRTAELSESIGFCAADKAHSL